MNRKMFQTQIYFFIEMDLPWGLSLRKMKSVSRVQIQVEAFGVYFTVMSLRNIYESIFIPLELICSFDSAV